MKSYQTATYWPQGERNGYGGIDYAPPVAIEVRWEDKQSLFIDAMGEEVVSKAVVYLEDVPDKEGFLFLGESVETNPVDVVDAHKIRAVSVIPNLSGTRQEIKAWL